MDNYRFYKAVKMYRSCYVIPRENLNMLNIQFFLDSFLCSSDINIVHAKFVLYCTLIYLVIVRLNGWSLLSIYATKNVILACVCCVRSAGLLKTKILSNLYIKCNQKINFRCIRALIHNNMADSLHFF